MLPYVSWHHFVGGMIILYRTKIAIKSGRSASAHDVWQRMLEITETTVLAAMVPTTVVAVLLSI